MAAHEGGERAQSAVLLRDHRVHRERSLETHTLGSQGAYDGGVGRHPGLHVAGATPVQHAGPGAADDRPERVVAPLVRVADRHHVDMPLQHQGRRARPRRRHHAVALDPLGLRAREPLVGTQRVEVELPRVDVETPRGVLASRRRAGAPTPRPSPSRWARGRGRSGGPRAPARPARPPAAPRGRSVVSQGGAYDPPVPVKPPRCRRETGRPQARSHEHDLHPRDGRTGDQRRGPRQDVRGPARRRRRRPGGTPRRGLRRPRTQRRRQDHPAEDAGHPAPAGAGRGPDLRRRRTPGAPRDPPAARRDGSVRLRRRAAHRHREPLPVRPAAGPRPRGVQRGGGPAARAVRPPGGGEQADQALLRRHASPARPGGQPDHPASPDLPRRADHRARPAHPRADVGDDPGAGPRRLHRPADHAVPRRGRPARRPDRRDRPGHQGRRGHSRRAEVFGRPLDAAAPGHRPRRPHPRRRHRPPDRGRGAGPDPGGAAHQHRPPGR